MMEEGTEEEGVDPLIWSPNIAFSLEQATTTQIFQSNKSFTVGNHLIFEWLAILIFRLSKRI